MDMAARFAAIDLREKEEREKARKKKRTRNKKRQRCARDHQINPSNMTK
eukprot:CAMPEP_0171348858 /NCGR_PEP_ID=MMETSP0878-20121228/32054_1 /TAXON_ID=67004 /ORGANISM="Thalassiosira weissflogii, Strain CCMP1336" /LENGTH=48 /DNA_ID= /DNA_START= /DNA_END= /DNA_ORIENTATION=